MLNKALFMLMRGIGLALRYMRVNLLTALALTALFAVFHIMFALGSSASLFAENAARLDRLRVYHLLSDSDLGRLSEELASLAEVEAIEQYSAPETKAFIAENAPVVAGIDSLPDELFPEFFELTVRSEYRNIEALEAISAKLYSISGVDSVSYGKDWAEGMSEGRVALKKILAISALFFISAALVIVYQAINISLYRYRHEIRVYSVMGATVFFIALPFLVVASLLGLACAMASYLLYALMRIFWLAPLGEALGLSFELTKEYFLFFGLGAVAVSAFACLISSAIFLKKAYYLNND